MHPVMILYSDLLAEVSQAIARLQDGCEHPDDSVFKVYDASTGNWDRGDDSYWANLRCYLCGKYWRVDSNKDSEEYRFKGKRVKSFPEACPHWSGPNNMVDPCTWNASDNNFWCPKCNKRWLIPPER